MEKERSEKILYAFCKYLKEETTVSFNYGLCIKDFIKYYYGVYERPKVDMVKGTVSINDNNNRLTFNSGDNMEGVFNLLYEDEEGSWGEIGGLIKGDIPRIVELLQAIYDLVPESEDEGDETLKSEESA